MNKKKWKTLMVVALAAAVGGAAAGFGTTHAANVNRIEFENNLTSYTVSCKVDEEFNPDTATTNGNGSEEENKKVVRVTNTGTAPVFVRVHLSRVLVDSTTQEEPLINDSTYADQDSMWGQEGAEPQVMFDFEANDYFGYPQEADFEKNWTIGNDGWLYYNYILAPGETTTPVMRKMYFGAKINTYEQFQNADCTVTVLQEAVQVSDEAEINKDATTKLFGKEGTVATDPNDGTSPVYDDKTGNYTSGYVNWEH